MPHAINKHGHIGIRRRCSNQHWRKPWYARVSIGNNKYIYSRNFATAEEAAEAYHQLKTVHHKENQNETITTSHSPAGLAGNGAGR